MIIFTIILVLLLAAVIVAAITILASGAGFILVFGDLIVCGLLIWLLVKLFRRKK